MESSSKEMSSWLAPPRIFKVLKGPARLKRSEAAELVATGLPKVMSISWFSAIKVVSPAS